MTIEKTREPQYQREILLKDTIGLASLGLMTNQGWYDDPKRLLFVLSRYKFVAKMLAGKKNVLEIGCGDAFATPLVVQEVGQVCAIDFDPVFVRDVHSRMRDRWAFDCREHDILRGPVPGVFDGVYSLDVIEHIPKKDELVYMANMTSSLDDNGILIIGTPSLQSQPYASPTSKEGHINCKNQDELKDIMGRYFHNVLSFSMNDEVVHTGFHAMAHYLFALGIGKKQRLVP